MNKELSIAIEELQQRPHNTRWFIPICLTRCTIPDVPIGYGQYLSEIHAAHLFDSSFEALVASIVETIAPFHHKPEQLRSYFAALKGNDKLCAIRSLLSFLISADTDKSTIKEIIEELTSDENRLSFDKGKDRLIFDQCIELARRRLANDHIMKIMGLYCDPESIAEVEPSVLKDFKATLPSEDHGKLYRPTFSWYVSDNAYDEIMATFREYDGQSALWEVFERARVCEDCNLGRLVLVDSELRVFDGEEFIEYTYRCSHCKNEVVDN